MFDRSKRRRQAFTAFVEALEARQLLSAAPVATPLLLATPDVGSGSILGYTPAQIRQAYAVNQIVVRNGSAGNGAGETIAIVDAYGDPDIKSDLATFDQEFGLSAPPSFTVVSQSGSTTALPAANAGWDLEISMDVEWAHAIAPSANILLVEANSPSLTNLLDAVNYARYVSSVSVISTSWGTNEFQGETAYDGYFTTPEGHQGITFVAASGDEGSADGADWPASSPYVLSVGGTTLNLTSAGNSTSETGWIDSTGGKSADEPEPGFQDDSQDTGTRTSPDVSYDANPNTGFAVYDSVTYESHAGWWEVGGTSAGTPQWAAIIAIGNQDRALAGLGTLNGITQTLPAIYAASLNSTVYADTFHDITSGNSGRYSATVGYDMVTGLGSPKANFVVQAMYDVGYSYVLYTSSSNAAQIAAAAKASGHAALALPAGELAGAVSLLGGITDVSTGAPLGANLIDEDRIADFFTNAAPFVSSHSLEFQGNADGSEIVVGHIRHSEMDAHNTLTASAGDGRIGDGLANAFALHVPPMNRIDEPSIDILAASAPAVFGRAFSASPEPGGNDAAWRQWATLIGAGILVAAYRPIAQGSRSKNCPMPQPA